MGAGRGARPPHLISTANKIIYDVHGLLCGRGHLDVHGVATSIVDLAYFERDQRHAQ